MKTIKQIMISRGDECEVDIDVVHQWLTQLPAEMYLELYHKMQRKVFGALYWNYGCCTADTADDNAKYYNEQPKVEKSL